MLAGGEAMEQSTIIREAVRPIIEEVLEPGVGRARLPCACFRLEAPGEPSRGALARYTDR